VLYFFWFLGLLGLLISASFLAVTFSNSLKEFKDVDEIEDKVSKSNIKVAILAAKYQIFSAFPIIIGIFIAICQNIQTQDQFSNTLIRQEKQEKRERDTYLVNRFDSALSNLESQNLSQRVSGVLTISAITSEFPDKYLDLSIEILRSFIENGLSKKSHLEFKKNNMSWPPRDKYLGLERVSLFFTERLQKDINHNIFIKTNGKNDYLNINNINLNTSYINNLKISNIFFENSNFSETTFENSDLLKVKFQNVNFNEVIFKGGNLENSYFLDSKLKKSRFNGTKLKNVNFSNSDLTGARFVATSMQYANFSNANLFGCSFTGSKLANADFSGADLRNSENLSQIMLDEAKGDNFTKLPTYLRKPEGWN